MVFAAACVVMIAMLMYSPTGSLSIRKAFATSGSKTFTTVEDFETCALGDAAGSNYKIVDEANGEVSLPATFEDDFPAQRSTRACGVSITTARINQLL